MALRASFCRTARGGWSGEVISGLTFSILVLQNVVNVAEMLANLNYCLQLLGAVKTQKVLISRSETGNEFWHSPMPRVVEIDSYPLA